MMSWYVIAVWGITGPRVWPVVTDETPHLTLIHWSYLWVPSTDDALVSHNSLRWVYAI